MVWKRDSSRWWWILLMSCLFYGWWDWRFLFLLLGTGTVDYFCGKFLHKDYYKKFFLWLSIVSNIGSLIIFKYSLFLAESLDAIFLYFGLSSHFSQSIPAFSLVLPVGISFYTFNSLSYTIDLYRNKAKPADSWLHFMAFISFFPHLVAGPIIRARDILSQLKRHEIINSLELYNGIKTCIYGLFQKMVLADNLAVYVNNCFDRVDASMGTLSWWFCMLAFSFQIYFDFNGYSTIARGIAKICGIHFKLNFNHPYLASGFSDFWKRWHISLSSFFRDYVYISMGGSRKGKLRAEYNRWITMLLSGLWHGANYTFLLWGAAHALMLSIENALKGLIKGLLTARLWRLFTFIVVVLTWVLFRSESLTDAINVYTGLFSWHNTPVKEIVLTNAFIWLILAAAIEWIDWRSYLSKLSKFPVIEAAFFALLIAITIYFRGPEQQFIYFQF
ncbi:MAG: MBOAT family protein [Bacteroidia bacterium]|nr:MBOAT family protein [Bacteroidia bacterium]